MRSGAPFLLLGGGPGLDPGGTFTIYSRFNIDSSQSPGNSIV
jgi:hypothetical protein